MRSASAKSRMATCWPPSALSTTIALNAPMGLSEFTLLCRAEPCPARLACSLRRNGSGRALHGPLLDRRVDQGRGQAEGDREPPHDVVAAVSLIEDAAEK